MDCSLDDYAKANKISSRGKQSKSFYNAGNKKSQDILEVKRPA